MWEIQVLYKQQKTSNAKRFIVVVLFCFTYQVLEQENKVLLEEQVYKLCSDRSFIKLISLIYNEMHGIMMQGDSPHKKRANSN